MSPVFYFWECESGQRIADTIAVLTTHTEGGYMVTINGTERDIAGSTVAEYLSSAGYDITRIAVELGGDIVPKSRYGITVFRDGDTAEIVSFVGGG